MHRHTEPKSAAKKLLRRVTPDPDTDVLPPDEETDAILAAQAGDRAAFAKIVATHWDRLFRWLFQMTRDRHRAEDLTQETFLKALAAVKSFRAGSNFRAWLFRIGHNNFVNLKRSQRRVTTTLPDDAADGRSQDDPANTAEERETLRKVQAAVQALPADFRAALLLRAEQDLSFRDVAAVMGITEETARWRVFKARQKLVQVLEEDDK